MGFLERWEVKYTSGATELDSCQEFEEYKKYPEYQRLHAGKMELDETLDWIMTCPAF